MRNRGLSVEGIGRLAGVSRRTVYDWLAGSQMRASHAERIVRAAELASVDGEMMSQSELLRHVTREADRASALGARSVVGVRPPLLFERHQLHARLIRVDANDEPEISEPGAPPLRFVAAVSLARGSG